MATIKISELFPIEEFKKEDLLEVVQDGKSRRASLEQLDEYMGSNLPITTEEDVGDLLQVDENGKWNKSKLINQPNGIAPLDGSGKIPSSVLPSYVDDVIEGYYFENNFYHDINHEHIIVPETGKIYLDITDNHNDSYRWVANESGGVFIKISSPIDISTTINETSTDSTIPTSKAVYNFVEENLEIPIIKIEYSQMISEDTIQFTPEQWEILTDNETKILFADVRDARWVEEAYYRILYKCGDYEHLAQFGKLYYEIVGTLSGGTLIQQYCLNGEERQLKIEQHFSPFINNEETPINGDMLKIDSDRISKAIPNEDYALPTVHLTIENSQITIVDNTYRFTLTNEQWNEYLKYGELLQVSLEVEVGEFEEYTFVKLFSGYYYTFSNGAYLDYITLSTYDTLSKTLIISSPMAIIPTHRGLLSEGDLLKCREDTIYPAVPNVDYITKEYLEDIINNIPIKKITESKVNVWDLDTGYYIRPCRTTRDFTKVTVDSNGEILTVREMVIIRSDSWTSFRLYFNENEYYGLTYDREDGTHELWDNGIIETLRSDALAQSLDYYRSETTKAPSTKAVYDAIQAALYVDSEGEV